ncbi:MAG: bifunctional diaminohydroxyphosphoribosylaminopyrimidine deaminase/5-amino-6-(5-phosphoribosylamino)uracil reductase RibD, partial [Bacteriovoracaceae bacterium]
MRRAFELSKMAYGQNFPNPLVGVVIVKEGRIIGEGFHKKYGSHHAEIEAILSATESVEGSDIYVTLEPCCHTNKQTPPCAQRLIKEKFKRVIISCLDPNPHVNGKGVRLLEQAGIEVIHGVLKDEGEKINEVFFHSQKTKLPFVNLKLAQSLDGKIALPTGESQWITGNKAREHAHHQRALHQAILIGANTLRVDNPKLNVRLPEYQGNQPYRVVFTESGNLDFTSKLFTDELRDKTIIYSKVPLSTPLPSENVVVIREIEDALKDLFQRKLINLYLEGGATLAGEFLRRKLINRISLYLAPTILGEGLPSIKGLRLNKLNERLDLENIEFENLESDIFLTAIFKR